MSSDLSEIERRIYALEQLAHSFHDDGKNAIAELQKDRAAFMGLYCMVAEIAEQHGISDPEFLRHWEIRRRYFYDYYVAELAKISEELAQAIDERSPNAARPPEGFPPLFPQQT